MGKSNKSHGKKTDQETQSPMLKIFKEIMQRENRDPEKANLLKEKRKTKKRRHYFSSQSKSEQKSAEADSSGTEEPKIVMNEEDYNQYRTHSFPFKNDKKETWWCKEPSKEADKDDTCSCVSCALKRIVSNEYACVACLLFLFTITIIVAFLLVFKTIPVAVSEMGSLEGASSSTKYDKYHLDSDTLKRKIDMINDSGGGARRDDTVHKNQGRSAVWDDQLSKHLDSLTALSDSGDSDFVDSNFLNSVEGSSLGVRHSASARESAVEANNKYFNDLASILDSSKSEVVQSSDRLRNFYKKLIETDAQIRNLKKGIVPAHIGGLVNPFRFKRSIFHHGHTKVTVKAKNQENGTDTGNGTRTGNTVQGKEKDAMKPKVKDKRTKRDFMNTTEVPAAIVFEKKKLVVEYAPNGETKKFPKCSHSPKDFQLYEKQLKHPFYKNSQRLDELLDQFMNKNFDEMMVEPFTMNSWLEKKKKCQHKSTPETTETPDITDTENTDIGTEDIDATTDKPYEEPKPSVSKKKRLLRIWKTDDMKLAEGKKEYRHLAHLMEKRKGKTKQKTTFETTTTSNYDVILSISTIINPSLSKKVTKQLPKIDQSNIIKGRKLMQADDEEEEGLGYEDFQEVLSDDKENHDETDRQVDRFKREEPKVDNILGNIFPIQYNPTGVYNPNWKGPMPLYPDELNIMIKNNFPNIPKIPIKRNQDSERSEIDLSDVEYIEDYANSKYDKLVEMAQAYSDYGVLDGKKDPVRTDKNQDKAENRVKLSLTKETMDRRLDFRGKTDTQESEGFKFVIKPDSKEYLTKPDLLKKMSKHIKFSKDKLHEHEHEFHSTTLLPVNPDNDFIYALNISRTFDATTEATTTLKRDDKDDYEPEFIYTINKLKRSLKSIPESEVVEAEDYYDDENNENIKFSGEVRLEREIMDDNPIEIKPNISEIIEPFRADNSTLYSEGSIDDTYINDEDDFNDLFEDITIVQGGYIDNEPENPFGLDTLIRNEAIDGTLNNIEQKLYHMNESLAVLNTSITRRKRSVNSFDITEEKDKLDRQATMHLISTDIDANCTESIHRFKNNSVFDTLTESSNNITTQADITIINDKNKVSIDDNTKVSVESKNINNTGMDAGEFFMMLSNWFGTLAGVGFDNNYSNNTNPNDLVLNLLANSNATENSTENSTQKKDIVYPMYDSDMVDNIGHRSRVLLSIEDELSNSEGKSEKKEIKDENFKGEKSTKSSDIVTGVNNITTATVTNINVTNTQERDAVTLANVNKREDANSKENKTVVKRSAIGSNLVFWNDIYDDEYGIQVDHIEKDFRDKQSRKKPTQWLQDKVKRIANNMRRSKDYTDDNKRPLRHINRLSSGNTSKKKNDRSHKINKREYHLEAEENEANRKTNFAMMSANMQEVCRQAALAVQQTRNVVVFPQELMKQCLTVREDEKEAAVATGLMQQLVQLMSDLVDYQVQQKTCLKLPPDLKEFLEWLTLPNAPEKATFKENNDFKENRLMTAEEEKIPHAMDQASGAEKEESHSDTRSECLGTLHAVKELMQQYSEMSDEDKSKMTGVKEYLESQLDYLNKQLAVDEYNLSNLYSKSILPLRFRRHLPEHRFRHSPHRRRHRPKRKLNRFMKFGKKRTRTTANSFDNMDISTDPIRKGIVKETKGYNDKETKDDVKRCANGDKDKKV